MLLHCILVGGISEEAALVWWLLRYTGNADQLTKSGRINKVGTPLYDTNWMPAAALIALTYREIGKLNKDNGYTVAEIARLVGKSHHAVSDLFARIDRMEAAVV